MANAVDIAHSVAASGTTELTRTVVRARFEPGDNTPDDKKNDDHTDDTTSTQWWSADGRRVQPTRVRAQYSLNGLVITGQPEAELDADEVTWFAHDAGVWLHLTRAPHGKWAVASSDHVRLADSQRRLRFDTPDAALYSVERKSGTRVIASNEW